MRLAKSLFLSVCMLTSGLIATIIEPTNYIADSMPEVDLQTIIPARIADWQEQKELVSAVINPQSQTLLNKLYTHSLSRTYVNSRGERIMLSVNYGIDQRDATQAHDPESCYPAQGLQVNSVIFDTLNTRFGQISVKRLETSMSNVRYEPVTYWLTVGDQIVFDGTRKKLLELRYGLKGQIPDGLLFRVSSIDQDTQRAFKIQDAFINALADLLPEKDKKRLMSLP